MHRVSTLLLVASLSALACSSSDSTSDAAGAGGGAGSATAGAAGASAGAGGAAAGAGGGAVACTGCAATEGCLQVVVTRSAVEKDMPWNAFPGKGADGKGTLWVTATEVPPGAATLQQAKAPDVDFTGAAAQQTVLLSCIAPGDVRVRGFLDDDGDATGASSSSDYLDTCLSGPRYVDATVVAGVTTVVPAQLAVSCD